MLAQGTPGLIVNTGSKQGITTPPGNLAYNVSKAALKTYTEGLAHELRNTPGAKLTAHLLIPGFTYTGLTDGATEKPAGAWTGEQVVDFMLESLARGDFYILCPDNETERADRRAPHGLGGRRHHREPAGSVALASRLQGGIRGLPEGDERRRPAFIAGLRAPSGPERPRSAAPACRESRRTAVDRPVPPGERSIRARDLGRETQPQPLAGAPATIS